mgnify:CR=1 FL=1
MRRTSLVAVPLLALAGAAAAKSYHGPIGFNGGSPFRALCNPGEILTGIAMQGNRALRVVAPICGRPRTATELDPASVYVFAVVFGTVRAPGRHLRCPANLPAVRGMWIGTHRRLPLVDSIDLQCAPVSDLAPPLAVDAPRHASWFGGDKGGLFSAFRGVVPLTCPQGEVAIGIFGRSGASIDSLGMVCDRVVLAAPAAPGAKPAIPTSTGAGGLLEGPKGLGGGPVQPGPITLGVAVVGQQAGLAVVRLTWSGATTSTVSVYRNGALLATRPNTGTMDDLVPPNTTYVYRLCNDGPTPVCSADQSVTA